MNDLKADGWISITEAGIILNERYLKTRDLMLKGDLGEVRQTDGGRYYVRETAVRAFADQRNVS